MAVGSSKNMQVFCRMGSLLFTGLANPKGGPMKSATTATTAQKRWLGCYSQVPRSVAKNVEMKKGDWICTRCNFMNFAKNLQCLQCDEHRPKKTLTGGEWECPECSFCNFGRNVVCLRCDCKKPADNRFLNPTSVLGLRAATSSVESNTDKIKDGIEEQQPWFTKIVELEKSSDMSSTLASGDLPETMKARDNRFDATIRNSGIEPDHIDRQTNDDDNNSIHVNISQSFPRMFSSTSQLEQHNEPNAGLDSDAPVQQQISREKSSNQFRNNDYGTEQAEISERRFKKVPELRELKDSPDAISDDDFPETMPMRKGENQFVVGKKKDRSLTSPTYKRRVAMEQTGKNDYVPFVPFPPDYFANDKTQKGSASTHSNEALNNVNKNPKTSNSQYNSDDGYSKSQDTSENASIKPSFGERSLEGSAVKESDPLDMSEEAKTERWFRRVAQIKDISELSQIPDEDFPSVMPMRKGVNRFVVSKRKTPLERRLTSPQYRRNLRAVGSDPIKKETDSD